MQKITPFLWFNDKAEEAVDFYLSVFKNSKVTRVNRYADTEHGKKGSVMSISFVLDGQEFAALNGGPYYTITPGISFVINCASQEEIDYYWEKLSEGGKIQQCGWLTDKYGVTWQVVPTVLLELLNSNDTVRTQRVTEAMLKMIKLDISVLEQAYNQ